MKLPRLRLRRNNNEERKRQIAIAERKARQILRVLRRSNLIYERKKDNVIESLTVHGVFVQDGKAYMPFARIPRGILATRLVDDNLIQSLRIECHDDSITADKIGGRHCYRFNVGGAEFPVKFSINNFSWDRAINIAYGASEEPLPALAFPLGVNADKEHVYLDLEQVKHLLVGGTTGHGKSTLFHAMVCAIIERNTPLDVSFWMADPKRTELSLYRKLMKKDGTGYVRRVETEPASILAMLVDLADEVDRRQREQERVGAVNLSEYARITGVAMPHIVLVIDEIADLITCKERAERSRTVGAASELIIARIARQGRSSGVHLVCATQHPEREVLTSQIKANMGARVSFSTVDHYKSMTILDDSRAVGLPVGRMWFRSERLEFTQIQGVLIHASQVKMLVDRIAKYGHDATDPETRNQLLKDVLLLVETAATQFDGAFSIRQMHEYLNGQVTQDRIREIGLRLEQDNVLKPGRGKKPRTLYPVFQSENRAELLGSIYGRRDTHKDTHKPHAPETTVIDGVVCDACEEHQNGTETHTEPIDFVCYVTGKNSDLTPDERVARLLKM